MRDISVDRITTTGSVTPSDLVSELLNVLPARAREWHGNH